MLVELSAPPVLLPRVATYTRPLATVGTENLTALPAGIRGIQTAVPEFSGQIGCIVGVQDRGPQAADCRVQ